MRCGQSQSVSIYSQLFVSLSWCDELDRSCVRSTVSDVVLYIIVSTFESKSKLLPPKHSSSLIFEWFVAFRWCDRIPITILHVLNFRLPGNAVYALLLRSTHPFPSIGLERHNLRKRMAFVSARHTTFRSVDDDACPTAVLSQRLRNIPIESWKLCSSKPWQHINSRTLRWNEVFHCCRCWNGCTRPSHYYKTSEEITLEYLIRIILFTLTHIPSTSEQLSWLRPGKKSGDWAYLSTNQSIYSPSPIQSHLLLSRDHVIHR